MRQKLAVLALAAACLAGLPLLATSDSPEPVEQPAETAPATLAADTETAPAAPAKLALEEILDDGRQEMACTPSACTQYCKTHWGPYAIGRCSGGVCYCIF